MCCSRIDCDRGSMKSSRSSLITITSAACHSRQHAAQTRCWISVPTAPGIYDESRFEVVIPGEPGVAIGDIPADRAYVGGTAGVVTPLSDRLEDVDSDGRTDLVLVYDRVETDWVARLTGGVVGLQYRDANHYYLVKDILSAERITGGDHAGDGTEDVVDGRTGDWSPYTFETTRSGYASAEIFTVTGRKVRTLVNSHLGPGRHVIRWDGRDDAGRGMPNGVYFYRVVTADDRVVRKIVLAR